jgi:hypothetical protein
MARNAVVCRQLGYAYGGQVANNTFGMASTDQPVWLSYLACNGSESNISACFKASRFASAQCQAGGNRHA